MLNKIKIGQKVFLSTAEQKLAHYVAKNRNGNNRYFNVTNLKISAEDPHTVDLEGIAGELAFCRLFNVYPDIDTDREPPHPFYDAVIPPPPGRVRERRHGSTRPSSCLSDRLRRGPPSRKRPGAALPQPDAVQQGGEDS